MMVVVNMACGLANRMFQYCFYLYLKGKGIDVWVDAYNSGVLAHEKVDWNLVFPNAPLRQLGQTKAFFMGGGNNLISRFRRKYLPFTTRVRLMRTAFDVSLSSDDDGRYIIGTYQNAGLVESIHDEVLNVFSFSPFVDEYNRSLLEEISSCESVAVHVRKGQDYQSRVWYHNTCPLSYYKDAIAMARKKLNNPRFYVFADNKEWVKDNFTDFEYTIVEGNPSSGWGAHFDMQLMSGCKHNIISNSTYSWWGAYLNRHENKLVIMPRQWFNPLSCADSTSLKLQCKGWIVL